MYTIYGQDATDDNYMKPYFMDGYIKREDYLYISLAYLKYDKEMAYSGKNSCDEDSSDGDPKYDNGDPLPPLTEGEISKARRKDRIQLFLIGRNYTKFNHAYVFDVHFNKSAIDSDVTVASAKRQRV